MAKLVVKERVYYIGWGRIVDGSIIGLVVVFCAFNAGLTTKAVCARRFGRKCRSAIKRFEAAKGIPTGS